MADKFKPDARQRRLIAEATLRVECAQGTGGPAPDELVARMTAEGLLVSSNDDGTFCDAASALRVHQQSEQLSTRGLQASLTPLESPTCRVILAAAVDKAVITDELTERFATENLVSATLFKVHRQVLLVGFDQQANHRDDAMVASVEAVLRAFPRADFIDLTGQNALIELLVDASGETAPDQKQLESMYRCTMPSDDVVALAASAVDGLLAQRHEGARVLEAAVFEVHQDFGIAHLTTPDGRMLCITERTPGIASLSQLEDGQRYRCWVQCRSNLVLRAEAAD